MVRNRMVVTGLGVVTPIGIGVAGVTRFDTAGFRSNLAAEVTDFSPTDWVDRKSAGRMDRFSQFAVAAFQMAMEDAGLDTASFDGERAGVVIGSGIGGSETIEEGFVSLREKDPRSLSPFFVSKLRVNMAACMVSIRYGLKGPLSVPSVACSAGSNTIGESLDHALSRGTEIYAEIAGYGNTADAHHFTAIAAGGIYDGEDIVRMLALGASGVQMGTRFVCCRECGVSEEFKEAYLNAEADDIAIVKSPVGMPGRAIRNRFVEEIEASEKTKIKCPHKCLSACKIESAKFCIAKALFNAYSGDVDHGLIFCGENAHRIDKITTVKELFEELLEEFSQKHKAA